MTKGRKPFKGWTGQMVVKHVVLGGTRLPSPQGCPPQVSALGVVPSKERVPP